MTSCYTNELNLSGLVQRSQTDPVLNVKLCLPEKSKYKMETKRLILESKVGILYYKKRERNLYDNRSLVMKSGYMVFHSWRVDKWLSYHQ